MGDQLREWWERKYFRVVAYLAFGLVAFFCFLLFTFPQHRVKQIASVQIESALDNRYDVSIADMGFWRLTGLEMEGVQIRERRRPDDGAGVQDARRGPPMTLVVNQLAARFSPIKSAFNRAPTVSYQVDVGGGIIDGTVAAAGNEPRVKVAINAVDLRQSTLLASLLGVPLFGVLDGDVDLTLDARSGQPRSGEVRLRGEQLTLGTTTIRSDKIPVFTEVELPTTNFGNLEAHILLEPGEGPVSTTVKIDAVKSQGRDINIEVWGSADLMARGEVGYDVQLRMQVNQEYVTANDLGFIFNMNDFRQGKVDDWYGFEIGGRPGRVNFGGSTTAARGPGAGRVGDDEVVEEAGEAVADEGQE